MSNWKPSTLWTIGILAGWLLLLLIAQTGILNEQGKSNGNKYGLVIAFLYLGPLVAFGNWIYMRKQEQKDNGEE
ncbi:hypothetical protein SAMN05444287_1618 [Octadecabacter temperatus]|uniref:Uncharacterized protein n=1 Tax=Octadecabacter temperatus TaxID=1458307 RepID=A0A0K0Y6M6_9RHOB|nr:hypothetical protein [Octadecabacter temperatus]AKS46502.1 hypothetical protein OSB_19620 [Octadecabacter temperatus]SIO15333.1 hypothetical protein SAMN05444287_1618 [Octadecabacter temperatus]